VSQADIVEPLLTQGRMCSTVYLMFFIDTSADHALNQGVVRA
jgi:hypothetical protein